MRKLKESGIEWIGMIPEQWELIRVKNIFKYHKDIVGEKEEEYDRLALTLNGVIKRDKNDSKGLQSENLSNYQILKEKELVFKMIDLANVNTSRVGYSPFTGIVSPVYIILNNDEYSKYGYYYFYSMWQREIFNNLGNDGVRSALNATDMLNLPFLKIPKDVANKIAIFLDKKVSGIDNVINSTKETIEDYKKLKQSIISKIIKEGLSKDTSFITLKLKNISSIIRGASPRPIEKFLTSSQEGVNWIKIGDTVKGSKYITGTTQKIIKEGVKNSRYLLPGDLILTNSMSYGEPYILDIDGCIHDGWVAFTNFKGIKKEYLYYFLASNFCKAQFNEQVAGGVVQNLNVEKISKTIIHLPSIEEQKKIIEYLDVKCNKIDKLIENKEKIIEELEQYKKSVIYEYVTGKKEVK